VSVDVHASVEDTEHLDPLLIHDKVGDPIVPVRCLSNLTVCYRLISLPESRMPGSNWTFA